MKPLCNKTMELSTVTITPKSKTSKWDSYLERMAVGEGFPSMLATQKQSLMAAAKKKGVKLAFETVTWKNNAKGEKVSDTIRCSRLPD